MLQGWGQSPMQYHGPSYIAPNQMMTGALSGLGGYYGGEAQAGVIDPTMEAWRGALDPMSRLTAEGAMNPLNLYAEQMGRTLDENIRPGYGIQGIQAGQYGGYSSERAKQERLAERNMAEAISDYGGNLFSDLYGQGLQMQQHAMGMAPAMLTMGAAPYGAQYGIGETQRGEQYQEQQMGNAQQQFQQMEPYQRAQMMANLLYPAAQLGGTASGISTSEREQEMSPLGTALGIGMMGLGAMGGMPGLGMGGMMPFGGGMAFNSGLSHAFNPMGAYMMPNLMAGPNPGTFGR